MLKRILMIIVILTLLLTACAQSSQPVSQAPASPTPSKLAASTSVQLTQQPGCRASGPQAKPNLISQNILPAPSEADWVRGPSDAYVTVIEYSDFQ